MTIMPQLDHHAMVLRRHLAREDLDQSPEASTRFEAAVENRIARSVAARQTCAQYPP
jgi:hypothetical protein